jgi:DNA-binding NarL/FixJ family response regulator
MAKQRPSISDEATASALDLGNGARAPRVFHNSYTRDGAKFEIGNWAVKLQHQGRRRTFSLRARSKSAAIIEARAISETLRAEGWDAVSLKFSRTQKGEGGLSKSDINFWKQQVVVRRYGFPVSGFSESDLSARIDHAGTEFWFPLGTPDVNVAAAKAREIYERVVKRGWDDCCRRFSRELIIGFEWCSNPILWTYTTIHTLVENSSLKLRKNSASEFQRVLIVERDAGIRRALEWCVSRQKGFCGVACESAETFACAFEFHKPQFVVANRNLAERIGFNSPGQIAFVRGAVPALTYSVAVDGDQLFVSTPGGAEGYMMKRVQPDQILRPVLDASEQRVFSTGELLPRVKSYFRELLQPRSSASASAIGRLTRRESEVLALLSKGCVDKEIAQTLGISAWTVHGHIKSIFERLNVRTRTEAVVRYLEK